MYTVIIGLSIKETVECVIVTSAAGTPKLRPSPYAAHTDTPTLGSYATTVSLDATSCAIASIRRTLEKLYIKDLLDTPERAYSDVLVLVPAKYKCLELPWETRVVRSHSLLRAAKQMLTMYEERKNE